MKRITPITNKVVSIQQDGTKTEWYIDKNAVDEMKNRIRNVNCSVGIFQRFPHPQVGDVNVSIDHYDAKFHHADFIYQSNVHTIRFDSNDGSKYIELTMTNDDVKLLAKILGDITRDMSL